MVSEEADRVLDLTGKVAVVAGAGSVAPGWGNGRTTAVLLARQGAAVYLVDLDVAAACETARSSTARAASAPCTAAT
jgi:NAD(P)-dependent dehydrogenase (short-subunit alcohol dehydrogenase family)